MDEPHDTVEQQFLLDGIGHYFAKLRPDQKIEVLVDIALFMCFQAEGHCKQEPSDHAAAYHELCAMNKLHMILLKEIRRHVATQEHLLAPQAFINYLFQEANNAGLWSILASTFHRCLPRVS